IAQQRLDRVRGFPTILAAEVVAERQCSLGMIEVQVPVDDIDEVNHEIRQDAAPEVPEPAPLSKTVLVERLRRRRPEKLFPVDRTRVYPQGSAGAPKRVAVPGEVHLVDVAELARAHDLARLLELRHAPLLHADLDDPTRTADRLDRADSFIERVGQRL